MILLIDIGNTNITLGACEGKTIASTRRVRTSDCADRDSCTLVVKSFLRDNQLSGLDGAVLCSVVPGVTPVMVGAVQNETGREPVVVSSSIKTGLIFSISNPDSLGADRIANAAAAHALYSGDLLIIDFGTATTFCVVTEKGEYLGGVIMPGPGMSAEALAGYTAKLPKVDLARPESVLGNDTSAHILSGIIYGQAGAEERIIAEIKDEVRRDLTVIVTGGYAELMMPYIKADHCDPDLTLHGLRVLYALNTEI